MSTQGIIVILLSAIGFLVASWIGIASMWVKDKFANHEQVLDQHDDRIIELENRNELADDQREEMLTILRKLPNVG